MSVQESAIKLETLREDLKYSGLALFYGFEIEIKQVNDSFTFMKDGWSVWSCHKGWQSAKLVDGGYQQHEILDSLPEALDRVLNEQV